MAGFIFRELFTSRPACTLRCSMPPNIFEKYFTADAFMYTLHTAGNARADGSVMMTFRALISRPAALLATYLLVFFMFQGSVDSGIATALLALSIYFSGQYRHVTSPPPPRDRHIVLPPLCFYATPKLLFLAGLMRHIFIIVYARASLPLYLRDAAPPVMVRPFTIRRE